MKLRVEQIPKTGRWKIQLWDHKLYRWATCPTTSTFKNKASATVGMTRYKYRHEGAALELAAGEIMASKTFCKGVTL